MASETYYYAWQNPVLRNTIYPFRDIKLPRLSPDL